MAWRRVTAGQNLAFTGQLLEQALLAITPTPRLALSCAASEATNEIGAKFGAAKVAERFNLAIAAN